VVLSVTLFWPTDTNFLFPLGVAVGRHSRTDKMKAVKVVRWRFFWVVFPKKYYLCLDCFQTDSGNVFPPARAAEVRFFCFFFLVKKRKVLKVLRFWSALPTASQSTHFTNVKYSVLYFTWKLRRNDSPKWS
jgi:hypothetical protein